MVMKAIRQREFGPAEVLVVEEVPDPRPGPGEVLVSVGAAGVHLLDTAIRTGVPGGPFPRPDLPTTPGREVAGEVVGVGPGVGEAWVGRRVVAHLGAASGGYAALALAPATALHAVPDGLDLDAAVTMIGTGRTAVGVLGLAAVEPGDAVVVPGAAGGLGALLVQAVRAAGATAVGVVGGATRAARVRELGVPVVDHTEPDWPEKAVAALGATPTLVLDGVGGAVGRAALELLDTGGRLVMFGAAAGAPTAFTSGDVVRRSLTVSWVAGPRMLRHGLRPLETRALAEAAAGRLVPLVHPPFALADAPAAHRALEERTAIGKVVLHP
jgi:NADPH2:quinone reductase